MKDPRGHGSNSRGGSLLTRSGRGIIPSRPHREGASNAQAAQALAHAKSTRAPVHDSMQGLFASIDRGHRMRQAGDGGHVPNFGMRGR